MTVPQAVIFDCDGVILQSNRLKSDAFGRVLEGYDPAQVAEFLAWHRATGGVSRFHKFARFFRDVRRAPDWEALTEQACTEFGTLVFEGLKTCATVPGFEALVKTLRSNSVALAVNTGGAEEEVRQVFEARGLAKDFDYIFGSPATKEHNMEKLRALGLAMPGAVYFGDSKLDFDLARTFDLRFIYVAYESEWPEGAKTAKAAGARVIQDFGELAPQGYSLLG
ncbi:HAD family hydrolase [uncultured Lentibacter sp.]|uniref:HAD family hydrolase n=1 Tax=uncultured Lentibacter sp. TaxID=1659309 RepID=UPI0026238586|nr:HAD hydrolase-like protein [uncultured Lentibacter sp.]